LPQVSCKATRLLLEAVESCGVDPSIVARNTSLSLDWLRDPRNHIGWSDFCRVNDEAVRAVGSGEELGVAMVLVDSYRLFRRAAGLVVSPHHLYLIGARWFSPPIFPHLPINIESASSRVVAMNISVDRSLRGCESFLHVCRGTFIAIPTLLGLPRAQVHGTIESHAARLRILLPEERRSVPSLLRRARAALFGAALFDELDRAQHDVNTVYDALLRSQQNFRQALERAPMAVLIQRDGRYVWVNSALVTALGWESPAQLIGRPLVDDAHPDEREQMLERFATPAAATTRGDWRIRKRDGSYAIMELAGTQAIEFEGRPARMIVSHDVTEQRRIREQLAVADRMASLGMLAAGVGHELNNPLTYVQLNLELIARELDKDGTPPLLKAVTSEAMEGVDRLRAIVADLRTLARTDDEKREPIDVETVIDSTLRLAGKTAGRAATIERERGGAAFVGANRARLGQVLLNLLMNAHDAIEDRGGRGVIRVRTMRDERGEVCIEIADSGIGIREPELSRVFDPFFTTKAVGRGTGLGLSICHQLVARFGGRITITSHPEAPGDRTLRTFVRVILPAIGETSLLAANDTTAPHTPRRVLIVDDEPLITRALEVALAGRHEVVVLDNGRAALDRLHIDRAFDLVLCDVAMPGLDGIELFEQARQLDPQLATRFVFMTGDASTPRAREFFAQCQNRKLDKPFDLARIVALADGH
jgi:PAS domain S-box-containing protein